MASEFHCPYRHASLLQQALAPDKMRVAFLIGAGCPSAVRIRDGSNTKPLIPDILGLTGEVAKAITTSGGDLMKNFQLTIKRLNDIGIDNPNIEEILSHIRTLKEIVGTSIIDGLSKTNLGDLDTEICKFTTSVVSKSLPSDDTPYHYLAAWVGGVKRAHPIEIFTPNYDLLIEQGLENQKVPYFDGFVGSDRTFFDLGSMEQDNLPTRWARLWKIHGSINWWRTDAGNIERHTDLNDGSQQMIHPSHLKYDESRRLPYLAMMDRLRSFLLHGQAVLVTCGYSFSDRHINDVILQGLSGNSTAICFGLLFGDRVKYPSAVSAARSRANLNLLAVDGAVINTIERDWHSEDKSSHPLCGVAAQSGELDDRTVCPKERSKFVLGDFKAFGQFLAYQLSLRVDENEGKDAK
jgi:hypothetical protein